MDGFSPSRAAASSSAEREVVRVRDWRRGRRGREGGKYLYTVARETPSIFAMSVAVMPFSRRVTGLGGVGVVDLARASALASVGPRSSALALVAIPEDDHGASLCSARRKSLLG